MEFYSGQPENPAASVRDYCTGVLTFIVLNYHRFMGFYYTPYWIALLGMRDLVHGPRSKQNHPAPAEPQQRDRQDVGAYSIVRWSPGTLGSRSTGLGKMVQYPRDKFYVAKWGVLCH
jgi:hypothetical protein